MIRTFKVDDENDAPDVESSSTHARSYHDVAHPLLEVVDGELSVSVGSNVFYPESQIVDNPVLLVGGCCRLR